MEAVEVADLKINIKKQGVEFSKNKIKNLNIFLMIMNTKRFLKDELQTVLNSFKVTLYAVNVIRPLKSIQNQKTVYRVARNFLSTFKNIYVLAILIKNCDCKYSHSSNFSLLASICTRTLNNLFKKVEIM